MLAFIFVLDVDTTGIVVQGNGHSTSSGNAGGKRRKDPKISSLSNYNSTSRGNAGGKRRKDPKISSLLNYDSTSSRNAGGKRRKDPKISPLLPSLTNLRVERLMTLVVTSEHILQRCPLLQSGSKTKCVANSCPTTHQTLRQQGGTGEDGHSHLVDWTLSVAATEKKK